MEDDGPHMRGKKKKAEDAAKLEPTTAPIEGSVIKIEAIPASSNLYAQGGVLLRLQQRLVLLKNGQCL